MSIFITITLIIIWLPFMIVEYIIWTANKGQDLYPELLDRYTQLKQNESQMRNQILRFQNREAPQFTQPYNEIINQLNTVRSSWSTVKLDDILIPELPAVGWLGRARYLYQNPDVIRTILTTHKQLNKYQQLLERGHNAFHQADNALETIFTVPERLYHDSQTAIDRLEKANAQLEQLAAANLNVEPYQSAHSRLDRDARHHHRQLQHPEYVSDELADQLGKSLARLQDTIDKFEADIIEITEQHALFETTNTTITQQIQELQTRANNAGLPIDPLQPLWNTLNHYQQRLDHKHKNLDFEALNNQLETYLTPLFTFAELLIKTTIEFNHAQSWLDHTLQQAEAKQLENALDQFYQNLSVLLNSEYNEDEEAFTQKLEQLTTQIHKFSHQLQNLHRQHKSDQNKLNKQAKISVKELEKAWQEMKWSINLDPGDPLSKQYQALLNTYNESRNQPLAQKEFCQQATIFHQDLQESLLFLSKRLQRIEQQLVSLPDMLTQMMAEANEWQCLQQELLAVRQKILQIKQKWDDAHQTGWLIEAHELLDGIKLINLQLIDEQTQLRSHAKQLNQLANTIHHTRQINENASDIDPHKKRRILQVVDIYWQQAHQAATFEAAYDALRKAEGLINELTIA
ncbi:MAG TPA: hypothetical protein VLL52_03345 [Anaerolineae bacterium]|nr:hypothetical protein [Anaerolineae bacterium]